MRLAAAVALTILALEWVAWPAHAGPFEEVPPGHPAYASCQWLAGLGALEGQALSRFSGNPLLTRYEFGLVTLEALTRMKGAGVGLGDLSQPTNGVQAAVAGLGLDPARASDEQLARVGRELLALCREFQDVLALFGEDMRQGQRAAESLADPGAVRTWRRSLSQSPPAAPGDVESAGRTGGAGLSVAVGAHRLRVSYDGGSPIGVGLMDRLALSTSRAASSPSPSPLGASRTLAPFAPFGGAEGADDPTIGIADLLTRRVSTSYEYGVTDDLTLSLAYEAIARTGHNKSPLDAASRTSLGVGYRIFPGGSLELNYSLFDYSNKLTPGPHLGDRMTETQVTVRF